MVTAPRLLPLPKQPDALAATRKECQAPLASHELGDKSQSTLWEEYKPAANSLHPTMKPVELVERARVNSSKAGDICADLFGGSGSTLIGYQRRGRRARLMELDPRYAGVICSRWEEYAGKTAVPDGDVRTFAQIAQRRHKEVA